MTKEALKAVLDRVLTWPENLQEEAATMLLAIETLGASPYVLSPEEDVEMTDALAEMERGEVATAEEVAAVFNRNR